VLSFPSLWGLPRPCLFVFPQRHFRLLSWCPLTRVISFHHRVDPTQPLSIQFKIGSNVFASPKRSPNQKKSQAPSFHSTNAAKPSKSEPQKIFNNHLPCRSATPQRQQASHTLQKKITSHTCLFGHTLDPHTRQTIPRHRRPSPPPPPPPPPPPLPFHSSARLQPFATEPQRALPQLLPDGDASPQPPSAPQRPCCCVSPFLAARATQVIRIARSTTFTKWLPRPLKSSNRARL